MTAPKATHPALYRSYQFFIALRAYLPGWAGGSRDRLTPGDEALIASILKTTAQRQLFTRMPPNDRRHALAVARALQQTGHSGPALLQAALLHDVAKSLGMPILHRVAIVLLEAFWPAALKWLSAKPTRQNTLHPSHLHCAQAQVYFLLHPFVVHAHHPAIGAAWAEEAGCDPLTVCLIARHQDQLPANPITDEDRLLVVLQAADNSN
jgi:hypothetical protein